MVRERTWSSKPLLFWGQATATNDSLSPCPVKVLAIDDLGSFVPALFYPDPEWSPGLSGCQAITLTPSL